MAWGAVRVWSDTLLGSLSGNGHHDLIAIDRQGGIVLHPDRVRIDRNVDSDPELKAIYLHWIGDGAIGERAGASLIAQDNVIAYAGVPAVNWLVVVRTPISRAFAALDAARSAAWQIGAVAAVVTPKACGCELLAVMLLKSL